MPKVRVYRIYTKQNKWGAVQNICRRLEYYVYRIFDSLKNFSEASLNKVFNGRVSGAPASRLRLATYSNLKPPHRFRLRIMPSSFFVVAASACLLLDPRGPQQVLIAEGVHPNPGPDQGIVKQAIENIEETMQQRKRREDREAAREEDAKPESCWNKKAKKLRYLSPSQEACGSNASANQFKVEGKGKLLRDKGGSQDGAHGQKQK